MENTQPKQKLNFLKKEMSVAHAEHQRQSIEEGLNVKPTEQKREQIEE